MNQPVDPHEVFARYFTDCEALAYALSSKLAEGNICLDMDRYNQELSETNRNELPFWTDKEVFMAQCNHPEFVTRDPDSLKPFVICNNKAYLHRYFTYETQIIGNIRRLGDNFHIITGGPGTGKTYSVSLKLAALFQENPGIKVALAAPTGKAAARMNESIRLFAEQRTDKTIQEVVTQRLVSLKAQTIHRLLGYVPDSVFFRHNNNHPLPYDVVIVDECSMIDGALMAKMLQAIGNNTALYLLGDKDQLASVEAGSVFGDICRAADSEMLKEKVEIKTESRRFDKHKGIGRFSAGIISGQPGFDVLTFNDEQLTVEIPESPESKNLFREKVLKSESFYNHAIRYGQYIHMEDIGEALKALNVVRFLCVTRENDYSVAECNKHIEKLLRQHIGDDRIFMPRQGFYHNQPVLVTQNDYNLGIFNGDVGLIRRESPDSENLCAFFETSDGEIKKIPAGYLNHCETVFAMTIHKSQGSEFDRVVVILPEKTGRKLLTRELLYTAVTRAKAGALIISPAEPLKRCVQQAVSRASGLYERLMEERV